MLDGRTAYAARFKGESPRNFTPFDEISARGREIWQGVEEAVRLEVIKPIPGWREAGAEDPHGTRYQCKREQIAGGHLTDDQAAFAVASTDRRDPNLEGVLAVARDRIRWLSRRNHYLEGQLREVRCEAGAVLMERDTLRLEVSAAKSSLEATVRDASGMREELALRASKITALEADRDALEHRRRWNVMEGQDGSVLICQNLHAKHEPCDYVEYVSLDSLKTRPALPSFGLPPGSLQAYSDGYKAAYQPGRHLDAHIAGLRAVLEHDPDFAEVEEEPTPYTVLATIYDGTKILAPATVSDRYSPEVIQAAIKDVVSRARGPRTGDMADVVDAINGEAAR
jgi:hypothetical protein